MNPESPVDKHTLQTEARSSVLLPLPLVTEGGRFEGELPTEEHVRIVMQMKKLVVLASGTADLGILSNEVGNLGGDFDLALEDGYDEEGEEGEGQDKGGVSWLEGPTA